MTYTFPSVSVVIPVYNGERTLGRCLESLLKQNYPRDAFEIIVVENSSTDATTEVAQRYPVRVLHNSERGPASARNMGIANSQSEIIAFTDADCIAHVDWLRELVQPYSDPEVGGVAGEIMAYEHDERNITEQFSDEFTPLRNFICYGASSAHKPGRGWQSPYPYPCSWRNTGSNGSFSKARAPIFLLL